jgi:hypothetical protein
MRQFAISCDGTAGAFVQLRVNGPFALHGAWLEAFRQRSAVRHGEPETQQMPFLVGLRPVAKCRAISKNGTAAPLDRSFTLPPCCLRATRVDIDLCSSNSLTQVVQTDDMSTVRQSRWRDIWREGFPCAARATRLLF